MIDLSGDQMVSFAVLHFDPLHAAPLHAFGNVAGKSILCFIVVVVGIEHRSVIPVGSAVH